MAEQRSKATSRGKKSAEGATKEGTSRRRPSSSKAAEVAEKELPEATEEAQSMVETGQEDVESAAGGVAGELKGGVAGELKGDQRTVSEELKKVVRESAIEVLTPVARKATTAAAKYAVTQGPKLATNRLGPTLKGTLGPKIEEAGGPGAFAKGALSTVTGAGEGLLSKIGVGGGEEARGTGKGRRLPIQESVDVAVDLETAYNQFTQFEDFPKFMHRVEKIEQRDDTHLVWHENIWGVRRQWEVEITEQRPNERIAWKSLSGTHTTGVVTFHRLSDRLTRIEVNVDFQPHGLLEKVASGVRMSRRALKSDLMRFKAFIEMREEETGAWLGRVEEGEVSEEPGGEEPEAEKEEEPEAERTPRRRRKREPEREEEEEEEEEETEEPELEAEEADEEYEEEESEAGEYAEAEEEEEGPPKSKPARRRPAATRRRSPAGSRGRR